MWPFTKTKPAAKRRYSRAYQAAMGGRLVADWNIAPASADKDIIPALKVLRARSRDLCQNNDYARRFLWLTKTNVVGHKGIMLQNKAKDDDGTLDTQANRQIESAWSDWGRLGECTMCGGYSWIGFQQAAIEAVARDGEALIQKVRSGAYGFRLHLIEADRLDEDYNDVKRNIKGGVQCDSWGRPIAYHLLKTHPGEIMSYPYVGGKQYTVVPAKNMIHLYLKERPGQTRGVPWLATPAYRLKQLGGAEEAELVASRLAASKMGFFTSPNGEGYPGDEEDSDGAIITEAEPGTFEQLPAGVDFKSWDPSHPNSAFDAFSKLLLRGIASGLNVSYISLSNNLEGVSYSSIRQGELSDRDAWRLLQNWLIENLIEPIYQEWLPMALLSGMLTLPARKLDKFNQPTWKPRGWNWVDPQKEVKSNIDAVRNGFLSLSDVLGEQGRDVEDVFERLAMEKQLAEKLGLDLPVLFGEPANEPAQITQDNQQD